MIQHIFQVPFTGLGLRDGYRGDAWLRNRIAVFKRFVLPALVGQTKKEFIVWVAWRHQEKENPIVGEFMRSLDGMRGMRFVHTFYGVPMWDDKYDDETAAARLKATLGLSLPVLASYVVDAEWVYLTCQPSDDMYAANAAEMIQHELPATGKAIGWTNGYVMNYATKAVAEYNADTLPPFATIIFDKHSFVTPALHYDYIGPFKSHEEVKEALNFKELPGRGFCVGIHGENISTTWNVPFKGRELTPAETEKAWLEFNCWDADPVVITKRLRLLVRIVVNALPRPVQSLLRSLYYSLR